MVTLAVAACSSSPMAGKETTSAAAAPTSTGVTIPVGPAMGLSPTPRAQAAEAAIPQCRSAELTVSLTPPEGAVGSVYRALVFTNNGRRSCQLRGFPGVSYLGASDNDQVGPAAQRVGDRGDQVPIAPGGTASAQLQLVNGT